MKNRRLTGCLLSALAVSSVFLCACQREGTEEDIQNRSFAAQDVASLSLDPHESLEQGARVGDHHAQYALAMAYLEGEGVKQDIRAALAWMLESAQGGYSPAQLALAKLYHKGKYIEENEYIAFQWYSACAIDEPEAAFEVGLAYLVGQLGCQKNLDLALRYLSYAEKQNNPSAKAVLDKIRGAKETTGSRKNTKNNKKINNINTLGKAALRGSPEAQLQLAQNLIAYATPQYDKMALHWVKQAALGGHQEAEYWLGRCYYEGIGMPVDYEKALTIFSKLAEEDHALSKYYAGKMYYEGQGIEQDDYRGKQWIIQAAEQGVEEAHAMMETFFDGSLSENEREDTQDDY